MSVSFKLSTPTEIKSIMLTELQESMGDIAEDLLPELAPMLLEDVPAMLSGLEQAVAAGAALKVKELAHTLKGSCASMGIVGLAGIFKEIEDLGREGDLTDAGFWVEQAHAEFTQVESVLSEYLA